MKDQSPDKAMAELFRGDPEFAACFFDEIFRDGKTIGMLIVLRQLAKASGYPTL